MPLTIGYKASAEQFGPRDLVENAVRAEQVGLDSVWVSDHFLPWRDTGGHAPSALTWMAAVGERTERVVIGTSVTTPTLRYNPAVMAQTFASMALLTGNRVVLGAGTGEALNEVAVSGMEWPEFKERFGRLRESVRLMRALWSEPSVDSKGSTTGWSARRSTTGPTNPSRSTSPPVARWSPATPDARPTA